MQLYQSTKPAIAGLGQCILQALVLVHRVVTGAYQRAGARGIIPKYLGNYNL